MRRTVTALAVVAVVVLLAAPVVGAGGNSTTTTVANETTTASTPVPTTTEIATTTSSPTPAPTTAEITPTPTPETDRVNATVDEVESRLNALGRNGSTAQIREIASQMAQEYPRAGPEDLMPLVVEELRQQQQREQNDDVQAVTPQQPANGSAEPRGERIDEYTTLVSSSLDDGQAEIVIQSRAEQSILLTDSAAVWKGGEVRQRQVMVNAGETVRITMPVTQYQGMAGVSLSASEANTLYGVPLKSEPGGFDWVDRMTSPVALLVGAVAVVVSFFSTGIWKLYVEGGEPVVADG